MILSHKVKSDNIKLYEYGLSTKDENVPFYFPKIKNMYHAHYHLSEEVMIILLFL